MGHLNERLSAAILGPGAIGGLLAALFWKNNYDVICIGKRRNVDTIASGGISLKSPVYGDFTASPRASTRLSICVDVLFVSVKTPYLEAALKRIDLEVVKPSIVVPLMNGRGHYEVLREAFGKKVIAGTIGAVEASKLGKTVHHYSEERPKIELGSNDVSLLEKLSVLEDTLKLVGLKAEILTREEDVIWNKLIRLDVIASMTTALQKNLGEVLESKSSRLLLQGLLDEAVLVAQKQGAFFSSSKVLSDIRKLPRSLNTSMQRDVKSGRASEVASITGGIITLAQKYGVPVPMHQKVFLLIEDQVYKARRLQG